MRDGGAVLRELESHLISEGFDIARDTCDLGGGETELLCMNIPGEEGGEDRAVRFFYAPLDGIEPLEGVDCLQTVYELPVNVGIRYINTLMEAVIYLNNIILAGHFGIMDGVLCYRYSYMIPRKGLDVKDYIDHILFMIVLVIGFSELLKGVNDGDLDINAFLEAIEKIQRG